MVASMIALNIFTESLRIGMCCIAFVLLDWNRSHCSGATERHGMLTEKKGGGVCTMVQCEAHFLLVSVMKRQKLMPKYVGEKHTKAPASRVEFSKTWMTTVALSVEPWHQCSG